MAPAEVTESRAEVRRAHKGKDIPARPVGEEFRPVLNQRRASKQDHLFHPLDFIQTWFPPLRNTEFKYI